MKKKLLTMAAGAAIVVGGISVAGVASAQTSDASPTDGTAVEQADTSNGETRQLQDGTDEERNGRHRQGRRGGGCELDTAAETIGVEVEELRAALDSGQSMAEVATANGVDPDTVVQAMIDDAGEKLSAKVDAGRLTQDEAAERLAEKSERIAARVFDTELDSSDEADADSNADDEAEDDAVEGQGS